MMNHQGQNNSNESIQSVANHWESSEALRVASSSSCTGSIQSFPNSFNPNFLPYQEHLNIVRSNDRGVGVIHHNLDLNTEYVENNHETNQNVSVGLCLHSFAPDVPDNQSDTNLSDLMAIDGGSSYVVDRQGVDNCLVNMSYLSSNRSPEHASREVLTGESSRSAVQARIPILQAATVQVNASNSLDIIAPYISAANIRQQQFDAEFSHETIRPVSNMRLLNEARHGSANSSLFSFEAGSNSLNIIAPCISASNIRQQQFDAEFGHETIRPVSNMHQLNEARHGSANSSLFSFEAGIDHGITRPVYNMLRLSRARQIRHFQSNNHTDASPLASVPSSYLSMGQGRNFHSLLYGQTPQYHQRDHPHFFIQAQASVGVVPYVQPFVQFPNFHEILVPARWFNVMGPRSIAPPFSPVYIIPGGRNPDNIPRNIMVASQTRRGAQSPYLANLSVDNGTANFLGNFASPLHYGPFSHSYILNAPTGVPWSNAFEQHMPMLLGVGNLSAAASIGFPRQSRNIELDLNSPAISQERDLAVVVSSAGFQNQFRTSQRSENQSYLNIGPPITVEARNNLLTEENRQPILGLSEKDIMVHLRLEEFQSSSVTTPESVESCCVCQDNYANGEDIGVLDCRHKFHYECIRKWLGIKNTCPVCVRTGLAL
ncbi:uncharacterized protein LOC129284540 [Prosopis cineraria]|uniref:uncharacterized protein LOC129284540 n=1 Tax=Prosopis cineraria TaxID=364024 RepID=UPI00240EB128|nr:uncharacterized protein LOC129284540 [Prosopis cineraria]